MPFYYPNKTNDFWRIMGLLFMGNRDALWNKEQGKFDLDAIRSLLNQEGIALWDTVMAVRRLKVLRLMQRVVVKRPFRILKPFIRTRKCRSRCGE